MNEFKADFKNKLHCDIMCDSETLNLLSEFKDPRNNESLVQYLEDGGFRGLENNIKFEFPSSRSFEKLKNGETVRCPTKFLSNVWMVGIPNNEPLEDPETDDPNKPRSRSSGKVGKYEHLRNRQEEQFDSEFYTHPIDLILNGTVIDSYCLDFDFEIPTRNGKKTQSSLHGMFGRRQRQGLLDSNLFSGTRERVFNIHFNFMKSKSLLPIQKNHGGDLKLVHRGCVGEIFFIVEFLMFPDYVRRSLNQRIKFPKIEKTRIFRDTNHINFGDSGIKDPIVEIFIRDDKKLSNLNLFICNKRFFPIDKKEFHVIRNGTIRLNISTLGNLSFFSPTKDTKLVLDCESTLIRINSIGYGV